MHFKHRDIIFDTHSRNSIIEDPVTLYLNWQNLIDVINGVNPLSTLSKLCP